VNHKPISCAQFLGCLVAFTQDATGRMLKKDIMRQNKESDVLKRKRESKYWNNALIALFILMIESFFNPI
jgi:hypothetical protein